MRLLQILLTNPALDPYGKIPEFKYCAAKIEKIKFYEKIIFQ